MNLPVYLKMAMNDFTLQASLPALAARCMVLQNQKVLLLFFSFQKAGSYVCFLSI